MLKSTKYVAMIQTNKKYLNVINHKIDILKM